MVLSRREMVWYMGRPETPVSTSAHRPADYKFDHSLPRGYSKCEYPDVPIYLGTGVSALGFGCQVMLSSVRSTPFTPDGNLIVVQRGVHAQPGGKCIISFLAKPVVWTITPYLLHLPVWSSQQSLPIKVPCPLRARLVHSVVPVVGVPGSLSRHHHKTVFSQSSHWFILHGPPGLRGSGFSSI